MMTGIQGTGKHIVLIDLNFVLQNVSSPSPMNQSIP